MEISLSVCEEEVSPAARVCVHEIRITEEAVGG